MTRGQLVTTIVRSTGQSNDPVLWLARRLTDYCRTGGRTKNFEHIVGHPKEGAAILAQAFADHTGPHDQDGKTAKFGPLADRQGDADSMTEQTARADEADALSTQIAAQEGEGPAILGFDLHGVDEVNAAMSAAVALAFATPKYAANRALEPSLPFLFAPTGSRRHIDKTVAVVAQQRPGQRHDFRQPRAGEPSTRQLGADFLGKDETASLGPAKHGIDNPLNVCFRHEIG
jgi:hypothetical protein